MMDVALDHAFAGNGWKQIEVGTGAVAVSSGVVTCSGVGDGAALMMFYVPVLPGMTVEAEIHAKLVSGTAVVALDAVEHDFTRASIPDTVDVDAEDWKRYRVSATVPLKASQPQFLRFTFGIATNDTGEAQFVAPVIRVKDGYGQPIVIAAGLIKVAAGTAEVNLDYPSFGIASVTRSDANTLTVTLDHELMSATTIVKARVYVSGTPDNEEIPLAGTVTTGATPTFVIKFSTGAAFADISSGTWYAFVRVEL